MKNQVTSIEQSKRLIEMGVPAEKASMGWFPVAEYTGKGLEMRLTGEYDLYCKDRMAIQYADCIFHAFTVADLLAVLPKTIWDDRKGWIHLIIRFPNEDHCKIVYDNSYNILWKCDGSLLSCIVETIGWVVTNGYRLNP